MNVDELPTLRRLKVGSEEVYHLTDTGAYRRLCEEFFAAGYNFPQVLSGVDMEYGLRAVLNLRRLGDQSEVTMWIDVPYHTPAVPSVCDLWRGVEWHEREAFDLLGIRFEGHPDLRRILLEDHWTTHPLQRRYDTGGYAIPGWKQKPWPDFAAIDREREEAERKEAKRKEQAQAKSKAETDTVSSGPDLKDVKSLNVKFVGKLNDAGIESVARLAALSDDEAAAIAERIGLRSAAAVLKWRDGAKALLAEHEELAGAAKASDEPALVEVKSLNPRFAEALSAQGISTARQLAELPDDRLDSLASSIGLRSSAAIVKWRSSAQELVGERGDASLEAAESSPQVPLDEVPSLNPKFADKLKEQGVDTAQALAALTDAQAEDLAPTLGLKSPAAILKWRDNAAKRLRGES